MRRIAKLTAPLLAMLLVFGSATIAGAQDPSPEEFMVDVDGFEKMYGRTATVDLSAPSAEPSGWFGLAAYALEFDSEEHAAAGATVMMENGAVQQMATMQEGGVIEEAELALDVEYMSAKLTAERDSGTSTVLQAVVQDGEYVYGVFGIAISVDPTSAVESLLTTMLENEVSDDAEMFHEDGTSLGGLWAKLPSVEEIQAIGSDLTNIEDQMVTPEAGTPAT